MKILVDIDNTTTDFTGVVDARLAAGCVVTEDPHLTIEGPTDNYYGLGYCLPCCQHVVKDPETNRSMRLIDHAVPGITALHRWGHRLYVVTARPSFLKDITIEYFDRHGVLRCFSDMIFSDEKLQIIQEIGIDVVVEDNPYHLLNAQKIGVKTITIDHPYNREVPGLRAGRRLVDGIMRPSWIEVPKLVDRISEANYTSPDE